MLNVITRSGANVSNGRVYGFFRDDRLRRAAVRRPLRREQEPDVPRTTPPFDQQRYGGFLGGPIVKNKLFYFGGLERLQLDSSDVLGISDYWRQYVRRHDYPDRPEGAPSGMVKVDANINQNEPRATSATPNTHKRDLNVGGHVARRARRRSTRSKRGRPSAVRCGTSSATGRRRSAIARSTSCAPRYGVNKPWILRNIAGGLGRLGSAGGSPATTTTTGNPTGKFARISYPGANFGATSFTGLEGEGNLFLIDNFSLLFAAGISSRSAASSRGSRCTWTSRRRTRAASPSRQDRSVRHQRSVELSHRRSAATSDPGGVSRRSGTRPLYIQDTWQATNTLTLQPRRRYDLDITPTTVNPYVDPYNERIVARLGGTAPLAEVGGRQEQLLAAFRRRLGADRGPQDDDAGQLRLLLRPEPLELHRHLPERDAACAPARVAQREHARRQPVLDAGEHSDRHRADARIPGAELPGLSGSDAGCRSRRRRFSACSRTTRFRYSQNIAVGSRSEFGRALTMRARLRAHADVRREHRSRHELGAERRRHRTRAGSALWQHHAGRQRRIHLATTALETRSSTCPRATAAPACLYTLSKTTSNTSTGLSTGGTTNPFDLNEDLGPDDNDRRHNVVFDGSYLVPKIDVQLAGITTYRSALPYSVSAPASSSTPIRSPIGRSRATRAAAPSKRAPTCASARSSGLAARDRRRRSGRCSTCSTSTTGCATRAACSRRTFGLPLTEGPKRRQQLGFRFDF